MQLSHNSRVQATHTGSTPETPGSGEHGTLHCREQDLFFTMPLLSRAGDRAGISYHIEMLTES